MTGLILTILSLVCGVVLLVTEAVGAPPLIGASHNFQDPVMGSVVVCDTAEQIKAIAESNDPKAQFLIYNTQRNPLNEPVCVATAFDATVASVSLIGTVTIDSTTFMAWDVGLEEGGLHALYLEEMTKA